MIEVVPRHPRVAVLYRARRERWWGAPLRLFGVIGRRRTATPAPWIYPAAAALGLLLGWLLDVLLGWPWWLVALGIVILVWAVFMSTAFVPRAGGVADLGEEVLRAVAPRRAAVRRERWVRSLWLDPPMPIFGLPKDWSGPRHTGGWSGSSRGIHTLSLRHGDANVPSSPSLIVESSVRQDLLSDEESARRMVEHRLWGPAFQPPAGLRPEELVGWADDLEAKLAARPDPEWHDAEVSVDGRTVPVRFVAEGSSWLAVGWVVGVTLTLEGTNFPLDEVRLVRLPDAREYLEGARDFRDRASDGSAGS